MPCRQPERVYGTFRVNVAMKTAQNGKNVAVSTEKRRSGPFDCQRGHKIIVAAPAAAPIRVARRGRATDV